MADADGSVEPGGPMTPEALRAVADWLDTHDRLSVWLLDALTRTEGNDPALVQQVRDALEPLKGTEVQDDLRRWAAALDTASGPEPPSDGGQCGEFGRIGGWPAMCVAPKGCPFGMHEFKPMRPPIEFEDRVGG